MTPIKDAKAKGFRDHQKLRAQLADDMAAYNYARRLKALNSMTP